MPLRISAVALVIVLGGVSAAACGPSDEDALRDEVAELQDENDSLRRALQEANEAIVQAADEISSAQIELSGDCEDLQFAVESMSEPVEVSEP